MTNDAPLRPSSDNLPPLPPRTTMLRCPVTGRTAAVADSARTRGAGGWVMRASRMAPLVEPLVADRTYYTLDEIAKHNTDDDAWMILNDKVYDVTMYAREGHPIPNSLRPYFGKDGTATKNKIHAYVSCHMLLRPFYVGKVDRRGGAGPGLRLNELPPIQE